MLGKTPVIRECQLIDKEGPQHPVLETDRLPKLDVCSAFASPVGFPVRSVLDLPTGCSQAASGLEGKTYL